MEKTITERQNSFINEICDTLGLVVPNLTTKKDASVFISSKIEAYRRQKNKDCESDWSIINGY